jgi:hypothetical protein
MLEGFDPEAELGFMHGDEDWPQLSQKFVRPELDLLFVCTESGEVNTDEETSISTTGSVA